MWAHVALCPGGTVSSVRFHRISGAGHDLFTALHVPAEGFVQAPILMCGGIGRSGADAEPLLRSLAALFARGGRPALRFDLSCSGESGGQCEEASVSRWLADVGAADAALRAACAAPRSAWFGVAAGANLMLAAARHYLPAPLLLVLLEPFANGVDDDLEDTMPLALEASPAGSGMRGRGLYRLRPDMVDIGGFPMSQALRADLREVGMRVLPALPDAPVLLLSARMEAIDDLPPGLPAAARARLQVVRIDERPGQPTQVPVAHRYAPRMLVSVIESHIRGAHE